MNIFLSEDFLLENETAKKLYHTVAKDIPIIDYHCHINPKDIAENTKYENITQIWLYGDHYKWRAMRSNGIHEDYITGNKSDYEKFLKFSKTIPKLIGSPLYHWTHLELKKFFGISIPLGEKTADEVWHKCNEKLKALSTREIINSSNVDTICTTDDPIDNLEYHKKIKNDSSFKTKVIPGFRPDKAINIDKAGFKAYIKCLSKVCNFKIDNIDSLKVALKVRIEYFNSMNCKTCDHGLDYIPYVLGNADEIFQKVLLDNPITQLEADIFKTEILTFLAKEYKEKNWVMELHFGVMRNCNETMFESLGPDTGFDSIGCAPINQLRQFLDNLNTIHSLPKTLIFSINPADNGLINTLCGCFQDEEAACKIQQGSAWWFNDTKGGMIKQLTSFAELSVLGNFVGMLTDSRSFLSYTRHEYFRRILCNFIGNLVEKGEYPEDFDTLSIMIADICYNNAKKYFNIN